MRTPGHAVVNLLALSPTGEGAAAVVGAILPDVPIALLYVRERWLRGTPEEAIWRDAYQRPFWQALVNGAHSLPLTAGAALVAHVAGARFASILFASMLLHALADLPLHAEDAHRQLFPFSRWRFVSPISYWDPRHHGRTVAALEAALVVVASMFVARALGGVGRAAVVLVSFWYLHGYWRTFVKNGGRWQPYF